MQSASGSAKAGKRGRPRVGDVRIECIVPKEVMTLLIERETSTNIYRTRIAAHILCNWASAECGTNIAPYH
jgi:hypothetical protein